MVEAAPEAQRGFYGSLVTAAGSCGAALASGCVAATAAALSEQQMAAWGWRIPFILGGALAPSSIALALWFAPEDSSSGGEEGEGGGPTLQSTSALDEADAAKLAGECSKEATSLTKDASPVKVTNDTSR
jgi:MHS family proline/betaine transporter-like MFS transporter